MRKPLLSFLIFFLSYFVSGQIIDTSFYSPALGVTVNTDVYLPPGYTGSPDTLYPVIYFLHGWGGSENSAVDVMNDAEALSTYGSRGRNGVVIIQTDRS